MVIQPWNLVFLVGFVAYMAIRGVFERRTRGNEKVLSRADTQDRILLLIVIGGSLLLPAVYLFTPWLSFADYRLPPFAPWCGAAVMVAALWLFWRSHADLGRNWSITLVVRKGHELIRHGVYRRVRHPMYAAIFLFCLAQGLLLQNWLAGWSAFATFAPLYLVRTPREERMMCDFFGHEYRDYMRQTGRLIPRVRSTSPGEGSPPRRGERGDGAEAMPLTRNPSDGA
jgi:protein-S-isoprenylcysteine O-methyltransferase Ste14